MSMDLLNEFEQTYEPASLIRRWLAALIDYLVFIFILYSLIYLLGDAYVNEMGNIVYRMDGAGTLLILFIPWFIMLPLLEGLNDGKTLGKTILGVQVMNGRGRPAGLGLCVARHLFDFVDYLPFLGIIGLLVAGNNPESRRVGDMIAKTTVVKKVRH